MKIDVEQAGTILVLRLEGRLDVVWADHVAKRVRDELRGGHHNVRINAAEVAYLSSAGIRVLIQLRREIAAVHGSFFVIHPSEFVDSTLRMSGLEELISTEADVRPAAGGGASPQADGRGVAIDGMAMEVHTLAGAGEMRLSLPARWIPWAPVRDDEIEAVRFPVGRVGLGIGAAGQKTDVRGRLGEFMAVSGCMALQPADDQPHAPDFVTQTGELVPELHAIQALVAEGAFPFLLRFQPEGAAGSLALSDLIAEAMRVCSADAIVLAVLAEAEGLVGSALSRSPGLLEGGGAPDRFPEIQNWMNFCGERVHAGTTALAVSFAARTSAAGPLSLVLAPMPSRPDLSSHTHAAAFPFRPLPDGPLPLDDHARALFDAQDPIDLLHLLEDDRPLIGLGQSRFIRGACWCAPLRMEGGRL